MADTVRQRLTPGQRGRYWVSWSGAHRGLQENTSRVTGRRQKEGLPRGAESWEYRLFLILSLLRTYCVPSTLDTMLIKDAGFQYTHDQRKPRVRLSTSPPSLGESKRRHERRHSQAQAGSLGWSRGRVFGRRPVCAKARGKREHGYLG